MIVLINCKLVVRLKQKIQDKLVAMIRVKVLKVRLQLMEAKEKIASKVTKVLEGVATVAELEVKKGS